MVYVAFIICIKLKQPKPKQKVKRKQANSFQTFRTSSEHTKVCCTVDFYLIRYYTQKGHHRFNHTYACTHTHRRRKALHVCWNFWSIQTTKCSNRTRVHFELAHYDTSFTTMQCKFILTTGLLAAGCWINTNNNKMFERNVIIISQIFNWLSVRYLVCVCHISISHLSFCSRRFRLIRIVINVIDDSVRLKNL